MGGGGAQQRVLYPGTSFSLVHTWSTLNIFRRREIASFDIGSPPLTPIKNETVTTKSGPTFFCQRYPLRPTVTQKAARSVRRLLLSDMVGIVSCDWNLLNAFLARACFARGSSINIARRAVFHCARRRSAPIVRDKGLPDIDEAVGVVRRRRLIYYEACVRVPHTKDGSEWIQFPP